MNNSARIKWVLIALFLAIAFAFQSIRLLLPMIPGPVNMFLIGSLLNAVMAYSIWYTKSYWAAIIGLLLPIGAFFQGQLPIIFMIPVVAIGNICFIVCVGLFRRSSLVYIAPVFKASLLYAGTFFVTRLVDLPSHIVEILLFMMSWPQIITGVIGILLAKKLNKLLARTKIG